MGSFSEGMRLGQSAYQQMLDNQARDKELAMKDEAHKSEMKERGLRISGLERTDNKAKSDFAASDEFLGTLYGKPPTTTGTDAQAAKVDVPPNAEISAAPTAGGLQMPAASGVVAPVAPVAPPELSKRDRALAAAKMFDKQQNWTAAGQERDNAENFHIDEFRSVSAKDLMNPRKRMEFMSHLNIGDYANAPLYSEGDITDAKGNATGHKFLVVDGSGKEHRMTFTNAQMIDIDTARRALEAGYGTKGMAILNGVSSVLAGAVKDYNSGVKDGVTTAETAQTNREHGLAQAKTADAHMISALAARDRATAEGKPKLGAPIQAVNEKNEPVVMQSVLHPDGSVTYTQAPLPAGLRLQKQVDPARVEARAAALVGQKTGRLVNGKPEVYTADTAYSAAWNQVSSPDGEKNGGLPVVKAPERTGGTTDASVTKQPTVPVEKKAVASSAPTRSTDGGKTWTLDIPETVRDPSVAFYREIRNPMASLIGKTFASRQEADAAFSQMNK